MSNKKVVAIVLAIAISLLVVGCSTIIGMKDISSQAEEALRPIASAIKEEDIMQKNFPGRGKPIPVNLKNLESSEQVSFDPTQAANTDVVNLTINYKVLPLKGSGILDELPWGRNPKVVFTTLIPKTIENRQEVFNTQFSVKPTRVFDLGDNRYAEFDIENLNKPLIIQISSKLELFRYDLSTASKKTTTVQDPVGVQNYLKNEKYMDENSPVIKEAASQIQGKDVLDTVKKIYDFDLQSLTYDYDKAKSADGTNLGAANAIKLKKGVCVEYSDVFVSLCRAKGIPARYIGGIPTEGGLPSGQGVLSGSTMPIPHKTLNKGHAWAEAFIKPYGWVPFDPTWGDTKAATFDRLRPLYIYLTDVRNDEVLGYSDIYGYKYWGAPVKVDFSVAIDSSRDQYLSDLLSSINNEKAELDQLKKQLDSAYADNQPAKAEIDQLNNNIAQLKKDIESGKYSDPGGYQNAVSRYNNMVAIYNEKVSAYNEKVDTYQGLRNSYEAKRQSVNALVNQYNSLN